MNATTINLNAEAPNFLNGNRVYLSASGKWVVDGDKTDARFKTRFKTAEAAIEFATSRKGNW